ncbi:FliH/SctL family protein [Candidatus Similichlamydia laticola]|uniref:Flagellar assembly protein FliH n=1 Tax=Candidatus Similichlamydia laticola TaxID=2170265 RepID=A0A369KGL5_9BACT|nr:FliH/SctL family protein [Candidatus Similichlamydia laticola]RDB31845.1 Type III secretion translocase SctL [Candidatus Similichlamydia laticola]
MYNNKKFLVLPMGHELTLAVDQRVVKKEELDTILSVQEVLVRAQEELIFLKKKNQETCTLLEKQAEERGFQKGLDKVAQVIADLERASENIRTSLEPLVIKIALKAAQSVIERELAVDPSAISDIVAKALRSVAQHKNVTLFCNEQALEILTEERPRLLEIVTGAEQFNIVVKNDLPPKGYIIQTERGIINRANVDEVWERLEKIFLKQVAQADTSHRQGTEKGS